MAESIVVQEGLGKEQKYAELIPQIEALVTGENDLIANLANVAAALKETFNFFWTGFYIVRKDELVLGPFQGPVACTRIAFGKGVCGTSWKLKEALIVPDVDKFPGHIACSAASKSEIVIPAIHNNEVLFILDVDSDKLNDFNSVDEKYLRKIVDLLILD